MARKNVPVSGWSACSESLQSWSKAGVVGLLKELHGLSPENRALIEARVIVAGSSEGGTEQQQRGNAVRAKLVEEAKGKLRKLVSTDVVYRDRFSHAAMKKVVDQLAKALPDDVLLAEVLIEDLRASLATFKQVGDDEKMVDHIYSVMHRLEKVMKQAEAFAGRTVMVGLAGQLVELGKKYKGEFGYGVSDELWGWSLDTMERVEKLGPGVQEEGQAKRLPGDF